MILFILAYLAGVLTIMTPCILPILPFVLARADLPFRRAGLPMLLGLAASFAAVASLASIAGNWAVEANQYGRAIALALMALFGLSLLSSRLATILTLPAVAVGARLAQWAGRHDGATTVSSVVLGVATGLLWAPCAGPVLGLILTGAALEGPGLETYTLLLAYGLGAATSLAAGILLGRRLLRAILGSVAFGNGLRHALGVAVIAGMAAISLGLDTGLLTRLSSGTANDAEQRLLAALDYARVHGGSDAHAVEPELTGPLASLLGKSHWVNAQPLQAADLRGRVVLVSFWTYSCINCLRVLPYLRAWAEKYRDAGLVVVGVHTPEFAFEKNPDNVRRAVADLGVKYPVVLDNDFDIWRSFGNRAWPALYFLNAEGHVSRRVLGEGSYEQSERLIQELLTDARGAPVYMDTAIVTGEGAQAAPDGRNLQSPETYIGYREAENFSSPGGIRKDMASIYAAPAELAINRWALQGAWTVGGESATLNAAPGRISYSFHARDLHLVLAPPADGSKVRFRVTIDGGAPGDGHGYDVDADGFGTVDASRLYQLVRQTEPVSQRRFEIEFMDPGVRAYAFTFG